MVGGGTYTNPGGDNRKDPTIQDYENIFGPAARDIKLDLQRNKRHARWHLPDALRGSNPYLTDRIDGLITDTTASPFTTVLLPYKYIENVDAKIKWNVWSFDEGMASRVPYESAARTLTQTKRSYAGYTIRHGLAITMEHNFMMSDKGRENFKNQLQQLVGCIQYTNDLDVHIALITAQSYAKERAEKYYMSGKTNHQLIREYIDLFGFMSKNVNAMDIMIEDAKAVLRTWGASEPNFLLCNSKLTFQMTMTPEKTQYLTQGPDGVRRLRNGPNITSYRGLNIIHSRSFSMEDGAPPRDVLRRRVRVAEYYRIPYEKDIEQKYFAFYDEAKDAWQKVSWKQLFSMANIGKMKDMDGNDADDDEDNGDDGRDPSGLPNDYRTVLTRFPNLTNGQIVDFEIPIEVWNAHMTNNNENLHPFRRLMDAIKNQMKGNEEDSDDGDKEDDESQHDTHSSDGNAKKNAQKSKMHPGSEDKTLSKYLLNPLMGIPSLDDWMDMWIDFLNDAFPNALQKNLQEELKQYEAEYKKWKATPGNTDPKPVKPTIRTVAKKFWDKEPQELHEILNDKFHEYFKKFLLGRTRNQMPYGIARFLSYFNWAGIHDKDSLLPDVSQKDIPSRSDVVNYLFELVYPNWHVPEHSKHVGHFIPVQPDKWELVVIRPNIEHNMLAIIMGRGGLDELGATFWGQTELSCYDDSMHGIWGMSYKYNEKAIVINNKNLIRLWDVAYDGYNGGKDCTAVNWESEESLHKFAEDTYEMNRPYEGASMMVMAFKNVDDTEPWPSPILFHDAGNPCFCFVVSFAFVYLHPLTKHVNRLQQGQPVHLHRRRRCQLHPARPLPRLQPPMLLGQVQVLPCQDARLFQASQHQGSWQRVRRKRDAGLCHGLPGHVSDAQWQ